MTCALHMLTPITLCAVKCNPYSPGLTWQIKFMGISPMMLLSTPLFMKIKTPEDHLRSFFCAYVSYVIVTYLEASSMVQMLTRFHDSSLNM